MAVYLISYDLKAKPVEEYESLIAYLKRLGALRILYSEWIVASTESANALCNAVLGHVEPNDHVWTMQITRDTAWRGSLATDEKINAVFAAG